VSKLTADSLLLLIMFHRNLSELSALTLPDLSTAVAGA
jgi:hypothetical protein